MILINDLNEACRYVVNNFKNRNWGEELDKLLNKKALDISVLKEYLNEKHINTWLSSDREISRESAIKILLTLKVSNISDAEEFLTRSCRKDGFYARDYKDLIYMFCLQSSLGIEKMNQLIDKYKYLDNYNVDAVEINKRVTLTLLLENKFHAVKTERELGLFFSEYRDCFGSFNRTAYKIFMDHYHLAVSDIDFCKSEKDKKRYSHTNVSVKELCEELKITPKGFANCSIIGEAISKHEPNRQKLTNIKNRKDKVPRKYLILFFMFTHGEAEDYREAIYDLNEILDECGMPRLDSRNPFDWIVMNSYYASAKCDFSAFDRMKLLVKAIYDMETGGIYLE